jgi:hypothetical protein
VNHVSPCSVVGRQQCNSTDTVILVCPCLLLIIFRAHILGCGTSQTICHFRALQMMQTSIGIDVRNHVVFCCYNPCCGGRKQLFESVRALSLHLARSPVCEQFANERRDRKRNARKFSLLNAEIVVQSSKRPTPLRQNVVNDIRHIVQHDCKNRGSIFPTCMATKWTRMKPICLHTMILAMVHCQRRIMCLSCLRIRTNLVLSLHLTIIL